MKGRYDRTCDLWSCGAIMYVLLCGAPPFNGDSDQEIIQKVRVGRLTFREPAWARVSEEAKFVVKQLMRMNAKERFTAEQALNSEWIKMKAPRGVVLSLQNNFTDRWRKYQEANRLRKAALFIIAGQLNDSETKLLRETFLAMDADGNGQLTRGELRAGLEKAGLPVTDADVQSLMEAVDTDGSGVIDYTEFIAASIDSSTVITREACWTAFNLFDRDGDGRVTPGEITQVLDNGMAKRKTEKMLKEIDTDDDGTLNFEEFMKMMDVQIDAHVDVLASPAEKRMDVKGVSLDEIAVSEGDPNESDRESTGSGAGSGAVGTDTVVLEAKPDGPEGGKD